jgi:hypothetical protein
MMGFFIFEMRSLELLAQAVFEPQSSISLPPVAEWPPEAKGRDRRTEFLFYEAGWSWWWWSYDNVSVFSATDPCS